MKKFYVGFGLMLLLLSCDEINKIINPSSDEYVINQTVNNSSNEQILESSSNIKIIFPAQSLSGNLEIKVKKESSYPSFGITNTKLGNNIFKIVYKGESNFLKPVTITINYDAALIPSGNNAAQSVKGFIYASGNWKLANYTLDETNKKIIISLNSISNPKIQKDSPLLQEGEGEIIIGDGYTTTDTGQDDNPIIGAKMFFVLFSSKLQPNGKYLLYDTIRYKFQGNNFNGDFNSRPDIENWSSVNPESTFEFSALKYSVSGAIENNNYKKILNFSITNYRNYYCSQFAWSDELSSIQLNNLILTYESPKKDTLIYEVSNPSNSPMVSSFSWFYKDIWESKEFTQTKSDLISLRVMFFKWKN